jgi:hypothetical protein
VQATVPFASMTLSLWTLVILFSTCNAGLIADGNKLYLDNELWEAKGVYYSAIPIGLNGYQYKLDQVDRHSIIMSHVCNYLFRL